MFVKFFTDDQIYGEYIKETIFTHVGIKDHETAKLYIFYTKKFPQSKYPFIWIKRGHKECIKIEWHRKEGNQPYSYIEDDIPALFLDAANSFINGEKNINENPLWDEFIFTLRNELIHLSRITNIPLMIIKPIPDGYLYGGIISHDIDIMRKWGIKNSVKGIFKKNYIKDIWASLTSHDPYYTFPQIIDMEKRKDISSAFYFMVREKDLHTRRYRIEKYISLIEELYDNDKEIGLHITRDWIKNKNEIGWQIKKARKLFNLQSIGIRFHYLMCREDAFDTLNQYSVSYDTTAGYTSKPSFNVLTTMPFKLPNYNIWEIPFSLMDMALYNTKENEGIEIIDNILNKIKYKGVFHALIHQHSYDFSQFTEMKNIVEYIYSLKNIYWQTPMQFFRRFKSLSNMKITKYLSNNNKTLIAIETKGGIKDISIHIYDPARKWLSVGGTMSSYTIFATNKNVWKMDIPMIPENGKFHITLKER